MSSEVSTENNGRTLIDVLHRYKLLLLAILLVGVFAVAGTYSKDAVGSLVTFCAENSYFSISFIFGFFFSKWLIENYLIDVVYVEYDNTDTNLLTIYEVPRSLFEKLKLEDYVVSVNTSTGKLCYRCQSVDFDNHTIKGGYPADYTPSRVFSNVKGFSSLIAKLNEMSSKLVDFENMLKLMNDESKIKVLRKHLEIEELVTDPKFKGPVTPEMCDLSNIEKLEASQ